jgi:hypothetical protein
MVYGFMDRYVRLMAIISRLVSLRVYEGSSLDGRVAMKRSRGYLKSSCNGCKKCKAPRMIESDVGARDRH